MFIDGSQSIEMLMFKSALYILKFRKKKSYTAFYTLYYV